MSKAPALTLRSRPFASTIAVALLTSIATTSSLAGEELQVGLYEERITVVGTRTERSLSDVAATIALKTAEDMDRELTRDIADLVRFEPGISVAGTGSRFGLEGFNIRGIGGNRVLTIVDGIRVPEEFSFGPFLSSRRDFVDVDSLQTAEIARGPISSLYGSDALGGVVSLRTKGPNEYLGDETFYLGSKLGFSSADASSVLSVTGAAGNEHLAGLLTVTRREGSETETAGSRGSNGPTREQADPFDSATTSIASKLAFSPSEGHELILGLDLYESDTSGDIRSDFGIGPTIERTNDDTRERQRVSLSYTFEGSGTGPLDAVEATIYQQSSETTQDTFEIRTVTGAVGSRVRDSLFEQDIEGAFVQLGKRFELANTSHLLTAGGDYYATDNSTVRRGATFNSAGVPQFEFTAFPTRDFPNTEVEQTAVFLQDEISFLDGRLLLALGLRWDSFDASVDVDQIYLNGNAGAPLPEDFDTSETTGKVGVVFNINQNLSVYGRYSEGFRAPPYDDVNVGFTNQFGGYKTISNPDLESESSEGIELGLRAQSNFYGVSVAVFQNDYDNFIQSLSVSPQFQPFGGVDPADGLFTFQSVNLNAVEIEGAELSSEILLSGISERLEGVSLRAAIAYADGEDTATGEPLNSVEPLSGVMGISFDAPSGRWGGDLIWTGVKGKSESDIDAGNPRLATGGYGIVDLLAYVNIGERTTVNVGLFNITDKTYIRWADTASIGTDAPLRFSQPGFNAGITLRVEL